MSAVLTSASVHDSQAATPLAETTASRVTILCDVMDSACDAAEIHARVRARRAAEAVRHNARSTAERANARLKNEIGGRSLRVRGPAKAACHLMFGVLALAVDQLVRLQI